MGRQFDFRRLRNVFFSSVRAGDITNGYDSVHLDTSSVAAARAAVATGAWVKSKHMYLIRGSVGA